MMKTKSLLISTLFAAAVGLSSAVPASALTTISEETTLSSNPSNLTDDTNYQNLKIADGATVTMAFNANNLDLKIDSLAMGTGSSFEIKEATCDLVVLDKLSGSGTLTLLKGATNAWGGAMILGRNTGTLEDTYSFFTGTINIWNGTDATKGGNYSQLLEIEHGTIAKNATIALGNYTTLAVAADNVKIAGLTSSSANAYVISYKNTNYGYNNTNNPYNATDAYNTNGVTARFLEITGTGSYEYLGNFGSATNAEKLGLKMSGTGTQKFSGTFYSGAVQVNSGTLELAGTTFINYASSVASGAKLVLSGTTTFESGINLENAGTLTISGSTIFGGTLTNTGTLDLSGGTIEISEIIVNSGTITLNDSTSFVLGDDLRVVDISTSTITYQVIDAGTIDTSSTTLSATQFTSESDVFSDTRWTISTTSGLTLTGKIYSDLVWSSGDWEIGVESFTSATAGGTVAFYDADSVTFNTENASIAVVGTLKPTAVTISANTTFTGDGNLTVGLDNLTIDSGATLTWNAGTLDIGEGSGTITKAISGTGTVKIVNKQDGHDVNLVFGNGFTGTLDFTGKFNPYKVLGTSNTPNISKIILSQKSDGDSMWYNGKFEIEPDVHFKTAYQIGDTGWNTVGSIEFVLNGDVSAESGTTITVSAKGNADCKVGATFAGKSTQFSTLKVGGGTNETNTSVTFSAGTVQIGTLTTAGGAVKVYGGDATINIGAITFSSVANLTLAKANDVDSTTFTVGDIAFASGVTTSTNMTIGEGVIVDATSISNNWGFGTLTVNGTLNVSGTMKLATGNQANTLTGTGTINVNTLDLTNNGQYVFDGGVRVNIGSGGIISSAAIWGNERVRLTNAIIGANADFTFNVRANTVYNNGGIFEVGKATFDTNGYTITIASAMTAISGLDQSIAKIGAGTLKFNTAQTLSNVTVDAGTLEIGAETAITNFTLNGGGITVDEGVTLALAGTLVFNSVLPETGAGILSIDSASTIQISKDLAVARSGFTATYKFSEANLISNISEDNISVSSLTYSTLTKGDDGTVTVNFGETATAANSYTSTVTTGTASFKNDSDGTTLSGQNVVLSTWADSTVEFSGKGTIANTTTAAGGAGGLMSFVADTTTTVNLILNNGIEANMSGTIQGNSNLTLYVDDASFYGNGGSANDPTSNPFNFDLVIGAGGVRLDGGSGTAYYTFTGTISGTGNFYNQTGGGITSSQIVILGDTSGFAGAWTSTPTKSLLRKYVFGDGTSNAPNGVVGGDIGVAGTVEAAKYYYTGDYTVVGNIHASSLEVAKGNATFTGTLALTSAATIAADAKMILSDSTKISLVEKGIGATYVGEYTMIDTTTGTLGGWDEISANDIITGMRSVDLDLRTEGVVKITAIHAGDLTWNASGSGNWNTTATNWLNASTSAADYFYHCDNVTFATANITITLTEDIHAGTVNINAATTLKPNEKYFVIDELNANATVTFVGTKETTIGSRVTISQLNIANNVEVDTKGAAWTFDSVDVAETGTIKLADESGVTLQTLNIKELTGTNATLNLISTVTMSTTGAAYFTLGNETAPSSKGGFTGTIAISNGASGRISSVRLVDENIAKGAVLTFGSENNNTQLLTISASTVRVAGLDMAETAKGTYLISSTTATNAQNSDGTIRNLIINAAEGGDYSYSGSVLGLNLQKDGKGTQTFTGTVTSATSATGTPAAAMKLIVNGGTLAFTGAVNGVQNITVGQTTVVDENGDVTETYAGTLTLSGATTIYGTAQTISVAEGGTLTISNSATFADATIISAGTTTIAGTITTGTATISGGTTTISGANSALTTATVSGGTLDFAGTLPEITVSGGTANLTNDAGTLTTANVTAGELNFAGTEITTATVSGGTLNTSAGTVASATITGGTLNASAGTVTSATVSGGTLELSGMGVSVDSATIEKDATAGTAGTLKVTGTATVNALSAGKAEAVIVGTSESAGSLTITQDSTINNLTIASGSSLVIDSTANVTLSGTVDLASTIKNGGTVTFSKGTDFIINLQSNLAESTDDGTIYYRVVTSGSMMVNWSSLTDDNFQIGGTGIANIRGTSIDASGAIKISALVWSGTTDSVWSTAKSKTNWNSGADYFANDDSVCFVDASTTNAVTLGSSVEAQLVLVNGDTTITIKDDYALTATSVGVADGKTLTLVYGTDMDYTKTSVLNAASTGTIAVDATALTGTHAVSLDMGENFAGTLNWSGNYNVDKVKLGNAVALVLNGANIFADGNSATISTALNVYADSTVAAGTDLTLDGGFNTQGAALILEDGANLTLSKGTTAMGNIDVAAGAAAEVAVSATIIEGATLTLNGSGLSATLDVADANKGTITVSGATLNVTENQSTGTINLVNGATAIREHTASGKGFTVGTIGKVDAESTLIFKSSANRWYLDIGSNFEGTLQLVSTATSGTIDFSLLSGTKTSGTTFDIGAGANLLTNGATSIDGVAVADNETKLDNVTITGDGTFKFNNGGAVTISGTTTIDTAIATQDNSGKNGVTIASGTTTISTAIGSAFTQALTVSDGATLKLTAAKNSFAGTLTVDGTLEANDLAGTEILVSGTLNAGVLAGTTTEKTDGTVVTNNFNLTLKDGASLSAETLTATKITSTDAVEKIAVTGALKATTSAQLAGTISAASIEAPTLEIIAGTATVTGAISAGTLTVSGDAEVSAAEVVSDSTIEVAGTLASDTTISATGITLTSGKISAEESITSTGKMTVAGTVSTGTLQVGITTPGETEDDEAVFTGNTLEMTSGSITATSVEAGTMVLTGTLTAETKVVADGSIKLSSGAINVTGEDGLLKAPSLTSYGDVSAATVEIAGAIAQSVGAMQATGTISAASITLTEGASLSAGAVDVTGTISATNFVEIDIAGDLSAKKLALTDTTLSAKKIDIDVLDATGGEITATEMTAKNSISLTDLELSATSLTSGTLTLTEAEATISGAVTASAVTMKENSALSAKSVSSTGSITVSGTLESATTITAVGITLTNGSISAKESISSTGAVSVAGTLTTGTLDAGTNALTLDGTLSATTVIAGTTTVNAGTLTAKDSLTVLGDLTIAADAKVSTSTLTFKGTEASPLTLTNDGELTVTTATIANAAVSGLTLTKDATLHVAGAIDFSGTNTFAGTIYIDNSGDALMSISSGTSTVDVETLVLNLSKFEISSAGTITYTIFDVAEDATLTGWDKLTQSNLFVLAGEVYKSVYEIHNGVNVLEAGKLILTVDEVPLTWNGGEAGKDGERVWKDLGSGWTSFDEELGETIETQFYQLDSVVFDDAATVTVSGAQAVHHMMVNADLTLNELGGFSGDSSLNVSGTLKIADDATLTINVAGTAKVLTNATIEGGKLVVYTDDDIAWDYSFENSTLAGTAFEKTGQGTLEIASEFGANTIEIKAGELQLTGAVVDPGCQIEVDGGAVLTVYVEEDDAVSLNYIGGTGSLTKQGLGELKLTGTATLSDGVNVNEGSLRLTSINAVPAGTMSILSEASLVLDVATSKAMQLSLEGDGTVEKVNSSSLTLTGDNSEFEGTFKISAGKLIVGDKNVISANATVDIAEGASLQLKDYIGEFASTLAGAGTLQVSAAMSDFTELSGGASAFAGTVLVDSGKVRVTNSLALGSSDAMVSVAAGTTFVIDVSADKEEKFGQKLKIENGVTLSKTGAGKAVLTNLENTIGVQKLEINAGTLQAIGAESLGKPSKIVIAKNATLEMTTAGKGALAKRSFAASSSLPTVTDEFDVSGVSGSGNLVFSNGGTWNVTGTNEVTGSVTVTNDTNIITSNVASVGRGTVTVSEDSTWYVTGTNGLTVSEATVTLPNEVYLKTGGEIVIGNATITGTSSNPATLKDVTLQDVAGTTVISFTAETTSDLSAVRISGGTMTADKVRIEVALGDSVSLENQVIQVFEGTDVDLDLLKNAVVIVADDEESYEVVPSADGYVLSTSAIVDDYNLGYSSMIAMSRDVFAQDILAIHNRLETRRFETNELGNTEFFAQVQGSSVDNGSNVSKSGRFDYDTYGAIVGGDARIATGTVVGMALGYDHGKADIHGSQGKVEMDNYRLTAFASQIVCDYAYVEGGVSAGTATYEIKRSGSSHAKESVNGYNLGAYARVGAVVPVTDKMALLPYVGASALYSTHESFSDGLYDVDSGDAVSVQGRVGASLRYDFSFASAYKTSLTFDVAYVHEFADDELTTDAKTSKSSFSRDEIIADDDYLTLGVEASMSIGLGASAFMGYSADIGENVTHHAHVGLRYKF